MKWPGFAWSVAIATLTVAHGASAAPSSTPAVDDTAAAPAPPPPPAPRAPGRAYQLSWGIDLPVIAIGTVMMTARGMRDQASGPPAYCLTTPQGCDKNRLLFIDRPFAGRYDKNWNTFSDAGAVTMGLAPLVLLGADGRVVDGLNDAVVIYESGLLASALSSLSTLSTERARPFVYGTKAPRSVRYGPDGALSYFSGHASFAFAMAMSTFWTVKRRHPHSAYPWVVLGVGLGAATAVATARVMAGKHFPTDVLAGAAVGASLGTLVPFLHNAPVQLSGTASAHETLIDAYGRF